jgi:uncharacterized protein YbbC (DUF1343 family)
MVLVEGTNLSEGRGTTRPFEFIGAPWLDPYALVDALSPEDTVGAVLRPCHFEPTFQKHAGVVCGGVQVHVTDPESFRSVRTAVALFRTMKDQAPDGFGWRPPPYEYEERLMPVDILWGHDGLRRGIDGGAAVAEIVAGIDADCAAFQAAAAPYRLG